MPLCRCDGSVFTAVMTRSALMPLVMNVLDAVDDVVVAVANRGGRHRRQVGADAGLGHGDGGDELAGGDAGQPAPLLLVGAVARKYGRQMSLWSVIPSPAPPTPAAWISSSITRL